MCTRLLHETQEVIVYIKFTNDNWNPQFATTTIFCSDHKQSYGTISMCTTQCRENLSSIFFDLNIGSIIFDRNCSTWVIVNDRYGTVVSHADSKQGCRRDIDWKLKRIRWCTLKSNQRVCLLLSKHHNNAELIQKHQCTMHVWISHTHAYIYIYIYIYVYIYICTYIYTYIYTHTYTSECVYICIYIYTYINICAYMQIIIRKHT